MPDEPQAEEATETSATEETSNEPAESQLGDAGKKALDEERKARRDAEARLKEIEPLAKKAQELEDAKKSETEKLTEQLTNAQKEAEKANLSVLRMEVALDKAPEGMSITQVRKLAKRLDGSTREELESDADELFEDFSEEETEEPQGSGRPKEKLTPGASSDADEAVDYEAIANRISDKNRI